MSLTRYQLKRKFSSTSEPKGTKSTGRKLSRLQSLFVIQKHAARRLHYDFRVQMEGVLKSWAVPKGIPLVQGEKKLAVQVEDHPLEYGEFEGIIPAGNYGAGTVMLWDVGSYALMGGSPREAMRLGKLALQLHGQKLKGHWSLIRMHPKNEDDENLWLLIKTHEDNGPISKRSDDRSVLSKRTMKQIAARKQVRWRPNQKQRPRTAAKK